MGYKWYAVIAVFFLVWLIVYDAILPGVNFLFLSTKDASVLENKLNSLIPQDMSIQDVVTKDLYLTAWDLNHRTPRFFSKTSQKKMTSAEANHDMPLSKMVLASAATPYYFKPATIEGSLYISGDNVASSPAMFAYYYVNEVL